MTVAYRLSSQRFPVNSGTGAALHGGRWNPVGVELVYAAASACLAVLEILVNFSVLPIDYALIRIEMPDLLAIEHIEETELVAGWNAPTPGVETRELGARWARDLRSPILCVPSAIMPGERNYVINPAHPDFSLIRFNPPQPFMFDPRLK